MRHGNAPCYKCEDRVVGCHSSCPRYAEFHTYCEQRRLENLKNAPVKDYKYDEQTKITRRIKKNVKPH